MDPHVADLLAYQHLVADLRRGRRPPAKEILSVLRAADRSPKHLIVDVFTGAAGPQPGDACPTCRKGLLVVYTSRGVGEHQVQRLRCNRCHLRPIVCVRIVPAASIFRRQKGASRGGAEAQTKKRR